MKKMFDYQEYSFNGGDINIQIKKKITTFSLEFPRYRILEIID